MKASSSASDSTFPSASAASARRRQNSRPLRCTRASASSGAGGCVAGSSSFTSPAVRSPCSARPSLSPRTSRASRASRSSRSIRRSRASSEVNRAFTGSSSIPARSGLRSMYAATAVSASSSSTRMLLNRSSQKAPVRPSSRLARRAMCSLSSFMYQEIDDNRARSRATSQGLARKRKSSIRVGGESAAIPRRFRVFRGL